MTTEVLSLLQCPVTASDLVVAQPQQVEKINSAISAGNAKAHNGDAVVDPVEGGLLNADRSRFVPLRGGIYCFNMESLIQFE